MDMNIRSVWLPNSQHCTQLGAPDHITDLPNAEERSLLYGNLYMIMVAARSVRSDDRLQTMPLYVTDRLGAEENVP